MVSGEDASSTRSGGGEIEVQIFSQSSKVTKLSSSYPLRLISPRPLPGSRATLVFILTYGGGLVAGDRTNLDVQVLGDARLGLLTQGSTRIYKSPSSDICTRQTLSITIRDGGSVLMLPDPVQPFADSVYEQRQIFHMDPSKSSLLLLDWLSEGRSSRGESWAFTSWKGKNDIWCLPEPTGVDGAVERRLLLRDNVKLDRNGSDSMQQLSERVDGMGVFGILIIAGPLFKTLGAFFLNKYASRPRIGEKTWSKSPDPETNKSHDNGNSDGPASASSLKWTAASVRGVVVVRFGAEAVEQARRWLRDMLTEDATVEREFGRQYLYCLQDR